MQLMSSGGAPAGAIQCAHDVLHDEGRNEGRLPIESVPPMSSMVCYSLNNCEYRTRVQASTSSLSATPSGPSHRVKGNVRQPPRTFFSSLYTPSESPLLCCELR